MKIGLYDIEENFKEITELVNGMKSTLSAEGIPEMHPEIKKLVGLYVKLTDSMQVIIHDYGKYLLEYASVVNENEALKQAMAEKIRDLEMQQADVQDIIREVIKPSVN